MTSRNRAGVGSIHFSESCLITEEAEKYGLKAIHKDTPYPCLFLITRDADCKSPKNLVDKFAFDMENKGIEMGNVDINHVRVDNEKGRAEYVTAYMYKGHSCKHALDGDHSKLPNTKTKVVCCGVHPCLTILAGIGLILFGAYIKYKTW
jgi:hypothetical protein